MKTREILAALMVRGVRQTEIAKRLGVSKGMISHVIHGRKKSYRIQYYIAKLLDEEIDEIWPQQVA